MGKKVREDGHVERDWESSDDELLRSPPEGKGKKIRKKVKYPLVDYHSLPAYLKDNEYILNYYRCEWPIKQTLLSIFSIHNETLNVWTHLLGFILFLSLTIYTAMKIPKVVDLTALQNLQDAVRKAGLQNFQKELLTCLPSIPQLPDLRNVREKLKASLPSMADLHIIDLLTNCYEHFMRSNLTDSPVLHTVKEDVVNIIAPLVVGPITRWPFYAFLSGAMFCLLASSTCHLLTCHSQRLSYIMLRLDYAGIAALISASFYPPVYYTFMCYPFYRNLYLGFITVLGLATILVSLLRVFQSPEYRVLRASLYFGMGVSGAVPVLHKLVLYWDQPEALQTASYEFLMGALYGLGALIYAMRIPERWQPGKFDIAGNSHQIFHILVVAGAYTHYQTCLIYLRWRDTHRC